MRRSFAVAVFIFALVLVVPIQAQARHGRVLGTQTDNINVNLATTQGSGFLLPNSPLYFLDIWRDNLSLFLSGFDKEAQAKLHLKIAGERITEVKIMLEGKDVNARGLDIALSSITENVTGAGQALKDQKNKGKNVEKLALELNEIIAAQKQSLRIIAGAYDDKISFKVKAVERAVEEEEIKIEDQMAADLLDNELKRELKAAYDEAVKEAEAASQKVASLEEKLEKPTPAATPAGAVAGSKVEKVENEEPVEPGI